MPVGPIAPPKPRRAAAWPAALRYAGVYALVLGSALALSAWATRSPAFVAAVFGALVGAALGSFANQAAYRLPRCIPLDDPPSSCPACHTPIRARDNMPVVSWLLLRGRCRACGVAIGLRYWLVEVAAAGFGAWLCVSAARALL